VPFRVFLDKSELGDALGKSPRSVVLVKDAGIAKAIEGSLDRYLRVLGKGGLAQ
jgi:ribosomal protein L7Ae-like RNA K-turn-binding protein